MKHITLLVLGSAVAACSSSSNKPTAEQYDDTAQAIGSQTATSGGGGDVASMSDSVSISLGKMPLGFSLQGDGHFQGSRLGVNYNYAITCKNLTGTVLGVCDTTTNEATVDVKWSGALASANVDAAVTRSGSWKLTGLQSSTVTFTGTGDFSFDTTLRSIFRPGVTATYKFDATATYNAVKITTQDRSVIDGSASFDISAQATVSGAGSNNSDQSFDVHADITFHADHTATLVLDGSNKYTLDLNTGVVVRVSA